MIERAILGAHAGGRKIGICGQAPSDHPDFAKHLVRWGIDSISLNPDAVLAATQRILACEQGRED
jgi:pyruvate,water dikinase